MSTSPLSLKPGEKGTIKLLSESPISTKLLEMGFLPGKEIRLLRTGLGGCPLYVDLQGSYIALRKEEAETILLESSKS